jgi:hypothetical protein
MFRRDEDSLTREENSIYGIQMRWDEDLLSDRDRFHSDTYIDGMTVFSRVEV